MKFLNSLEEKLNDWLWALIHSMSRLIPTPLKECHKRIKNKFSMAIEWFKQSPALFTNIVKQVIQWFKTTCTEVDLKNSLSAYEEKFKDISHKKLPLLFLKNGTILLHLIKRPFRDFSGKQTALLTAFSVASLIAGLTIYSQFRNILSENTKHLRTPASVEVLEFDRPNYYKKEFRHVKIVGLRIPVYYPKVNEFQTVTIDFNLTLNNRIGRLFIEKREFPVRDHLIENLEPILAEYSLDTEGKSIIKEKIIVIMQDFLDQHNIESEVTDLTITYILAN